MEEKRLNPRRIRRFASHLSVATTKYEDKMKKKADVRSQIEKLKSLSLNKRTKKEELESAFSDFEDAIHQMIMDEEKILEYQRQETKEIQSLKGMIEDLSRKLVQLGREYALEMERKDKKILELRDTVASARMGGDRKEKIATIEKKVMEKAKGTQVTRIQESLKALEETHAQLVKSGAHPKKDLDRLKKTIDSHKRKLQTL